MGSREMAAGALEALVVYSFGYRAKAPRPIFARQCDEISDMVDVSWSLAPQMEGGIDP